MGTPTEHTKSDRGRRRPTTTSDTPNTNNTPQQQQHHASRPHQTTTGRHTARATRYAADGVPEPGRGWEYHHTARHGLGDGCSGGSERRAQGDGGGGGAAADVADDLGSFVLEEDESDFALLSCEIVSERVPVY